jgi:hypothetical protein
MESSMLLDRRNGIVDKENVSSLKNYKGRKKGKEEQT